MRLNHDCTDFAGASEYLRTRAVQLLMDGFVLDGIVDVGAAAVATFKKNYQLYVSIYVYAGHRGKGTYLKVLSDYPDHVVLTSLDCGIYGYLAKNKCAGIHEEKIKYHLALGFHDYQEYQMIRKFYGDGKAKRSGVYFMNHIDEGLAILTWIGASLEAKKAYCLHPIYQMDDSFAEYGRKNLRSENIFGIDANVIANAVEYRHVANAYLSNRRIYGIDEIALSPLKDVNDMLIADKIQNRKDFELYHLGKHDRSDKLVEYFHNWLQRLSVPEHIYQKYKNSLSLVNF